MASKSFIITLAFMISVGAGLLVYIKQNPKSIELPIVHIITPTPLPIQSPEPSDRALNDASFVYLKYGEPSSFKHPELKGNTALETVHKIAVYLDSNPRAMALVEVEMNKNH